MKAKNILFFLLAAGISYVAATHRFGDSAHAIGLITAEGGKTRHAAVLETGKDGYTLIATATVLPPYHGDARVTLEGEPEMDYALHLSGPVIDFGIRRNPEMLNGILYNLQPKDRIALWVVMTPPAVDPVCGMTKTGGFPMHRYKGKDYYFCSDGCLEAFTKEPEKYRDRDGVKGAYTLAFHDLKTGNPVLNIPITIRGKEDREDAGGHHH